MILGLLSGSTEVTRTIGETGLAWLNLVFGRLFFNLFLLPYDLSTLATLFIDLGPDELTPLIVDVGHLLHELL